MNLKFTLRTLFDNKVDRKYYQLDLVTLSKNVFWSVNFALLFWQIYFTQMTTFLNNDIFTKKLHTLSDYENLVKKFRAFL